MTAAAHEPQIRTDGRHAPAPRGAAVIAGTTTLAMGAAGIFANAVVLALTGSTATTTASQIAANPWLLRFAIVAFLLVAALDIVLAWALWLYFGRSHRDAVTLAAWLRVAYAAILVSATTELSAALRITTEVGWGAPEDAHAALGSFVVTWQLGLMIFALHLAVLAAILIRDTGTPTILGILIGLAGLGYAVDGIARLLLPADAPVLGVLIYAVAVPSVVGEFGLAFWFLFRGGRKR